MHVAKVSLWTEPDYEGGHGHKWNSMPKHTASTVLKAFVTQSHQHSTLWQLMENVCNHFWKARHYTYMYLANLGVPGGSDLEKLVRDYKKSHRRISAMQ